jgi:hypothetical protein
VVARTTSTTSFDCGASTTSFDCGDNHLSANEAGRGQTSNVIEQLAPWQRPDIKSRYAT